MSQKIILEEKDFTAIQAVSKVFTDFFDKLFLDESFKVFYQSHYRKSQQIRGNTFEFEIYSLLFFQDVSASLALTVNSSHINIIRPYSLMILFNPEYQEIPYSDLECIKEDSWLGYRDFLIFTKEDWIAQPRLCLTDILKLPEVLAKYDITLVIEYLKSLYRFVSIIISAETQNGLIAKMDKELLNSVARLIEKYADAKLPC